jgi:superfamily II DNA or RNA helicase
MEPLAQEVNGWQQRDYQLAAHDAVLREFTESAISATLVVMPTGTGKTRVATMVAETAARTHGRQSLFLAHRELLVSQAAETMLASGLTVLVEMAGQDALAAAAVVGQPDVVVGTVQSLQGQRLDRWPPNSFGMIVTDECHRAATPQHRATAAHFPGAWHLGITATADGASGRIGEVYKSQAYHYPIQQAVLDGWLVVPKHERCKLAIDLRGLRMTRGDFNVEALAERISPHVSVLADAIKQRIGRRFSVVFTPDVGSAMAVAAALRHDSPSGPGIPARYVAGDSGRFGVSKAARKEGLGLFADRKLQVLCCCDLLIEGWDATHVEAVVIARPTTLRYRYAQMVGRGMRICPETGKSELIIVDFDWQYDPGSRALVTPIEYLVADDDDFVGMMPDLRAKVISRAREQVEKGADVLEAIQKAKDFERYRTAIPAYVHETQAQFEVEHYDPLVVANLCGFTFKKQTAWIRPGLQAAYPGQIAALKRLGVYQPENLSFFGAADLLRKLEKRQKQGLTSYTDIHRLVKLGFDKEAAAAMSMADAAKVLNGK